MRPPRAAMVLAALATTAACDGASPNPGPTEDVQVTGGQFVLGPLPGVPPIPVVDAGAEGGGDDGGAGAAAFAPLSITQLAAPVLPLPIGSVGQSISGLATVDAVAVGVRFADLGTGYWIVPVGVTDPQYPGQVTFGMRANFAPTIPAGPHDLRVVAIGASGNAGTQSHASVCFEGAVPDNGHACNPANPLPAAVIALSWDTNFDLDLHVVAPNGDDFNPKVPLGSFPDSGARPAGDLPSIDRDSLAGCAPDGLRQEDLVFQTSPAPGTYDIYVDPFAPCGQAAAHFTVTVYEVSGSCPACSLQPVYTQSGELLASETTGGAATGLFVHPQPF